MKRVETQLEVYRVGFLVMILVFLISILEYSKVVTELNNCEKSLIESVEIIEH